MSNTQYSKSEEAITAQKQGMTEELHKLECAMEMQKSDIKETIATRVDNNQTQLQRIVDKNKQLQRENTDLHDRMGRIEMLQLGNNVIITGIPEQWESYKHTKQ